MIICIDCQESFTTREAFDVHVCEVHKTMTGSEVIARYLRETNAQFVSRTAPLVN